jgi:hypothetical protein
MARISKPVKPVFSAFEWKTNLGGKNAFVTDIMSNPKIFLIGEERDLA